MIACIAQHGRFRVIRADNDVLAGIQRVSTALQQEQIRFSAACTDTLREFGMYCWEDARHGDAPKKEFDHAMDDVRYFVTRYALFFQYTSLYVYLTILVTNIKESLLLYYSTDTPEVVKDMCCNSPNFIIFIRINLYVISTARFPALLG